MNGTHLVRLVAAWLAGASGINAHLATIPRDGSDTVPADLTVLDETGDRDTALGRVPELASRPAAQVAMVRDAEESLEAHSVPIREFQATLGVRLTLSAAQTEAGARDLYYYVKATLEALTALHRADETGRTRGAVILEHPLAGILISPIQALENDEAVSCVLTVRYQARDQA